MIYFNYNVLTFNKRFFAKSFMTCTKNVAPIHSTITHFYIKYIDIRLCVYDYSLVLSIISNYRGRRINKLIYVLIVTCFIEIFIDSCIMTVSYKL